MSTDPTILIIDSDNRQGQGLAESLGEQSDNISVFNSGEEALDRVKKLRYDLVITEAELAGDVNGFDILNYVKHQYPSSEVIMITANATIDSCKQAIRAGAYDYLEKPLNIDHFKVLTARALSTRSMPVTMDGDFRFEGIISRSHIMQSVFHVVRRVAATDISVLIEGESGTGKELIARAIHLNSLRNKHTFNPINCAGLTESLLESELFGHSKGAFTGASADRKGILEMADKGTLFLDEIGDMPLNMQAKLLRVLEDGVVVPVGSSRAIKVDVRVISATNHDLAKLVEEKKFRQDLYFRIKGVSLSIPPLRSREEDIEELFGYFLKQACDQTGRDITRITEPAMEILKNYHWPGNIRQLKNVVKTMVVLCEGSTLDVGDIPPDIHRVKRLAAPLSTSAIPSDPAEAAEGIEAFAGQPLDEVEKEHIKKTLEMTNGNRSEAAKLLKIGERTLYRKIKEYEL